LSACQTGLGLWQPGEHLAGLRHAFLAAGARHVATTLWDVNDASAPRFVADFYRRVSEGMRPAAALWSTQRQWLESTGEDDGVRAALVGAWTMEAIGWEIGKGEEE
jgi:CHAT domain-containing protein